MPRLRGRGSAQPLLEEADTEHGDRRAGVKDPFGNVWWLATPKPTLT